MGVRLLCLYGLINFYYCRSKEPDTEIYNVYMAWLISTIVDGDMNEQLQKVYMAWLISTIVDSGSHCFMGQCLYGLINFYYCRLSDLRGYFYRSIWPD